MVLLQEGTFSSFKRSISRNYLLFCPYKALYFEFQYSEVNVIRWSLCFSSSKMCFSAIYWLVVLRRWMNVGDLKTTDLQEHPWKSSGLSMRNINAIQNVLDFFFYNKTLKKYGPYMSFFTVSMLSSSQSTEGVENKILCQNIHFYTFL